MKNKLFINSLSGTIQFVINFLILLFVLPHIIRIMGLEFYNIFLLVLVIGNLNSFITFGFSTSLMKYLSEQGKTSESNIDIISSLFFTSAIILPFTVVGIIYNKFILVNVLNIPLDKINDDLIWMFNLYLLSNCLMFVGQIPTAILESLEKIYLTNFYQVIYLVLNWGLLLLVILYSSSRVLIGVSSLASSSIWLALVSISARKAWGKVTFKNLHRFWFSLKKQISYGIMVYFSGILGFFHEPLSKLLISHFIGINEVLYFDIAIRIKNQIFNFFIKLHYPFYPVIGRLRDKMKIRKIISEIEQAISFLILPLIPIVYYCAPIAIKLWLGYDNYFISYSSVWIILGYMVFSVNIISFYQYLIIKNHPDKTIYMQGVNAVANSLIFFLLYKYFSYKAIIISNFAAVMTSFLLSLFFQKKFLNNSIFETMSQLLKYIVMLILLIVVSYTVRVMIKNDIYFIITLPIIAYAAGISLIKLLSVFNFRNIAEMLPEGKINRIFRLIFTKTN